MKRESKLVLLLVVVVIGVVSLTFGARPSRALSTMVEAADSPRTLHHPRSVASLFPPGR